MTLELLLVRHSQANEKWLAACKHKDYPYDETKPLSFREKRALRWAIRWRRAVHELEAKMLKDPQVRAGLAEGLRSSNMESVAYFEAVIETKGRLSV